MKLLSGPRQPFVGLAAVAAMGVIFADCFPLSPSTLLAISTLVVICAFLFLRWPTLSAMYAIVGAGFFLLHDLQSSNTEGQRLAAEIGNSPRVLTATGFVISEPKIAPNGFATFLLKLESVELEGRKHRTQASWLVRWRGAPEYGDELRLFGIAEVTAPPRNPGEFDMRSYLARHDVRRTFFVRYPEDGALVRHNGGNPILRAAQKSRGWMQNALCRGLEGSPDVQNFLNGIVLGLRHQTPEDIEEPFQQTGTLHLFAVAGLHVGIVATLLWMLATVARLSRKWATALIIPLLLFYAAVTGLHVSSVRAAVMTSILLGGFFFERKVFVLNSLAAAAFFLLCWNTSELFSTGFQLSFSVVSLLLTPLLLWPAVIFDYTDWFLPLVVLGIVLLLTQVPGGHFYLDRPHWPQNDVAKIAVLGLGAGAAVHLRTRSGDWLFDCGSDRTYKRVVREYLHAAGVNRLDGLLLTHGDSLHIGCATELLCDFPGVRLIDTLAPDRSAVHQRL